MFEYLRKIFSFDENPEEVGYREDNTTNAEKKLQIATCTLFIQLAKADDNFTDKERDTIISILKSTYHLEDECIDDLIKVGEKRLENDDSIYDLTQLINQNLSNDEKFELLKNLWRLIYVDEKLDIYVDHLIKKIGGLINMGHEDIIGAKMLVKEEQKDN